MAQGFVEDRAYQKRLHDVLLKAIMTGMQQDGAVVLRTGDVAAVLADLQGMMLGMSPHLSVPSRLRVQCEELKARTARRAREMQQHIDRHGAPFETVVVEGAMN